MDLTETHYYQLDLIQGDLCLELESDDREFIAHHMQRWYEMFGYGDVPVKTRTTTPETSMVSMSGPAPVLASGLAPAADTPLPSQTQSQATDPVNQMLLEQITQLQQQVQVLTQQQQLQVQSGTVLQTQAASITSYSSIAAISSISSAIKPSPEASVDVFVAPAHEEMQGDFDSFLSVKPEPEEAGPTFEHPVENPTITVENEVTIVPEFVPEPQEAQDSSENLMNFRQPVENMSTVVESLQSEPPDQAVLEALPAQSVPEHSEEEDLDLILDSLASDLEAPSDNDQPPPSVELSAESVEGPVIDSESPVDDILGVLAQDLESPHIDKEPSRVAESVQTLPDLSEFMPSSPTPDLQNNNEQAFDEALASAFDQQGSPPSLPEKNDDEEEKPPYSRPEVDYDFGIPLPDPPTDPAVQNLSLEVLENQEAQPFESPFPKLSEDGEELITPEPVKVAPPPPIPTPEPVMIPQADPQKIASLNSLQVETLADLYEMAPGASPGLDYLLLSAYYLSSFKQMERYALKNLNSQLLVAGLTPVNHGTVETAVSKGFIELIPDTVGTAPAAEYALTETGINYACSLIKMS